MKDHKQRLWTSIASEEIRKAEEKETVDLNEPFDTTLS
jgi:hypothetical protein